MRSLTMIVWESRAIMSPVALSSCPAYEASGIFIFTTITEKRMTNKTEIDLLRHIFFDKIKVTENFPNIFAHSCSLIVLLYNQQLDLKTMISLITEITALEVEVVEILGTSQISKIEHT